MLILSPDRVTFGERLLHNVSAVTIDREFSRLVQEWSDLGPHQVLAEAVELRTTIRVIQRLADTDLLSLRPGESGPLVMGVGLSVSDAARRHLVGTAVVLSVKHEVSIGVGKPATRTTEFVMISDDGAAEPLVEQPANPAL